MNDDEIEQHLRELPGPPLPEAWRKSILAAARGEPVRARETWPAILFYLRHLFARDPITAGGLAALWLLILVLKGGTPGEQDADRLLARANTAPPPSLLAVREHERFMCWLQNDDMASAQTPLQP